MTCVQSPDRKSTSSSGSILKLQEQVIEVAGLTLQLEVVPGAEAPTFRMRIAGNIPFGNRDIYFDKSGKLCGVGTAVQRRLQAACDGSPHKMSEPSEVRTLTLQSQTFEDYVTGLTFRLEAVAEDKVAYRVQITGTPASGQRDLDFDAAGRLCDRNESVKSETPRPRRRRVAA